MRWYEASRKRTSARYGWLFLYLSISLAVRTLHAATPSSPKVDFLSEALAYCKKVDPSHSEQDCVRTLNSLVNNIRKDLISKKLLPLQQDTRASDVINVLNQHILVSRNVSYISNRYWRDSLFSNALLKNKGNCLATSLLYQIVARRLKLPIRLTFVPRHALVAWWAGDVILFIETTAKGKTIGRDAYLEIYGLDKTDLKESGYGIALTDQQILSHLCQVWSGVLQSMNRIREARTYSKRAAILDPDSVHTKLKKSAWLQWDKNPSAAETSLKDILANSEGGWAKTKAALSLSQLYQDQGQPGKAAAVLRQVFDYAPKYFAKNLISTLGVIYRHMRKFDEAIRFHKMQAKLDPGEDSFNQLGSVLTEAHKDKEAIAAYERALLYNPECFFTQIILAGLYERSGDKKKGRDYFAKIEEPREHLQTYHCALVWYYANIKEEEKLYREMETSLKMDPTGQVYYYFVREPDIDPYRKRKGYVSLMEKYKPKSEQDKE